MSVSEAAGSSRRDALVALRDRLARALDDAEDRYCGPLARQFRDVLAELDSMAEPEGSQRDEIAERRAQRRAAVQNRAGRANGRRTGSD